MHHRQFSEWTDRFIHQVWSAFGTSRLANDPLAKLRALVELMGQAKTVRATKWAGDAAHGGNSMLQRPIDRSVRLRFSWTAVKSRCHENL